MSIGGRCKAMGVAGWGSSTSLNILTFSEGNLKDYLSNVF